MTPWLDVWQESALVIVALLVSAAWLATRGQAAPSWRLALWFLVPLALSLGGFVWPLALPLAQLMALTLIVLCLADRFFFSASPDALEARRIVPEKLSLNQPNPVVITLYANGDEPVALELIDPAPVTMRWQPGSPSGFKGHSRFAAFARVLAPRQRHTLEYHVVPQQRGRFVWEPLHLRYRSRLGLLWIQRRVGRRDTVTVYPDLRRMAQLRTRFSAACQGGEFRGRRVGMQGHEFASLRAYAAGDDLRQIAWKATARMEAPVSQVWQPQGDQPVQILLDAGRLMSAGLADGLTRFDWALNAAMAFASVAIDHGDRVGLTAFHQTVLYRAPMAGGRPHLNRVMEAVFALQPATQEPDYEGVMTQVAHQLRRRSLVVVLTDLADPMASYGLIRGLQAFARRHLLLVLSFRDPKLAQHAAQYPETIERLYEKSVALDLAQCRARAYGDLARRTRAVVLDAEPARLDETLIQRYMALKYKTRF